MTRIISIGLLAVLLAFQESSCRGMSTYLVGNSFTGNCEPECLPALAAEGGRTLATGWHVKHGSPLHNIWGLADSVNSTNPTYGKFRDALPGHAWDAVALQAFYKRPYQGFDWSTMQTDVDSALAFIDLTRENPANADTKFYVYASWPFLWTGKPYQEAWGQATVDDPTTKTSHTREYFRHLTNRLRAATDAEVYLIPIPEVLDALDKKLQAGALPGFSGVGELMLDDDNLHLNAGLGHYTAGATVYATLFGESPAGLAQPDGCYEGGDQSLFTPEAYALVHETVWEVVSTHEHTGVVPEPASWALMAVALTCAAVWRRRGGRRRELRRSNLTPHAHA